jgi:hypothetical protein
VVLTAAAAACVDTFDDVLDDEVLVLAVWAEEVDETNCCCIPAADRPPLHSCNLSDMPSSSKRSFRSWLTAHRLTIRDSTTFSTARDERKMLVKVGAAAD